MVRRSSRGRAPTSRSPTATASWCSSSSAKTADGQPDLLIRGDPDHETAPTTSRSTSPGIYFGQDLDGYVVVNSKREEIDFEDEDGRQRYDDVYDGEDGVKIDSWIKRAAFALRFGDFNPLVSGNVTSNSRVLINRDINARLKAIAPFLTFDGDPYPVILDGKVQWIVDGYTTTDRYPYAQRAISDEDSALGGRFNYVRNSVKAVVDAYDGTTTLYIVDQNDPIIRAYRKAFPKLFADDRAERRAEGALPLPRGPVPGADEHVGPLPPRQHRRLLHAGPAWSVAPDPGTRNPDEAPTGTTATTIQTDTPPPASGGIAPYYQLMRLPGETEQRFSILRPFVPDEGQRQQMTAFMIAKSDPEHYGELQTFVMPGNRLPAAPLLVASTMSSDPAVSQLQTLLGVTGGGSRLLFGNLLIVPVEHSLLYVRPGVRAGQWREQPAAVTQGRRGVRRRGESGGHPARGVEALPAVRRSSGRRRDHSAADDPDDANARQTPRSMPNSCWSGRCRSSRKPTPRCATAISPTFQQKYKAAQTDVSEANRLLAGGSPNDTTTTTTTSTTSTTSTTLSGASA